MNKKIVENKKDILFNVLLQTINNTQILSTSERKSYIDNISPKCKKYLRTELAKRSKKNELSELEEEFYSLIHEDPIPSLFPFNLKGLYMRKESF